MRTKSTAIVMRSHGNAAGHHGPVCVRFCCFLHATARASGCGVEPHIVRTGPLNRERFVAVQIDLLRFVLPSDHLIRGGCEDHRMCDKEEEHRAEKEEFSHFRLSLEEFRVVCLSARYLWSLCGR